MKAAVQVFISSLVFSAVVAAIYWGWAREYAGLLLLGLMAVAMGFIAVYVFFAERGAQLAADDPTARLDHGAGERVGIFTTRSPWPILLAVCAALTLGGFIIFPFFGVVGFVLMLAVLWALVRESR